VGVPWRVSFQAGASYVVALFNIATMMLIMSIPTLGNSLVNIGSNDNVTYQSKGARATKPLE